MSKSVHTKAATIRILKGTPVRSVEKGKDVKMKFDFIGIAFKREHYGVFSNWWFKIKDKDYWIRKDRVDAVLKEFNPSETKDLL